MVVPITTTKWSSKQRDIRLVTKSWSYKTTWVKKEKTRKETLRKVVMRKTMPLKSIMTEIYEFVESGDERLIAGQMDLNGRKEGWVSQWASVFQDYDVTVEEKLEKLQNDGGSNRQIKFYEDLQRLNLFDVELATGVKSQATCQMLHDEVSNFRKGFPIWV